VVSSSNRDQFTIVIKKGCQLLHIRERGGGKWEPFNLQWCKVERRIKLRVWREKSKTERTSRRLLEANKGSIKFGPYLEKSPSRSNLLSRGGKQFGGRSRGGLILKLLRGEKENLIWKAKNAFTGGKRFLTKKKRRPMKEVFLNHQVTDSKRMKKIGGKDYLRGT